MAFLKRVYPEGNPNDTVLMFEGRTGCCGDTINLQTWSNTGFDIGTNTINGINIDGTLYTFTTPADTQKKLNDGIIEAFKEAGYLDVEDAGVVVSGASTATVATIKTSATLTILDGASSDVTLTAA